MLSLIQEIITRRSFASFFIGKTIREEVVGDCVYSLFPRQGYRVAVRVNPWKLVGGFRSGRKAISILKQYRHPLQPEVDILIEDSERSLWAHELKLIRWSGRGIKFVVPRGRLYEGLGQALALTTYGVDYVCLWHIFVLPMAAYRKLETLDPAQAEEIDDERIEFGVAYNGITPGVLQRFRLPIGYVAFRLYADTATASVEVAALPSSCKAPDKLERTETGDRVRPILLRAFDA